MLGRQHNGNEDESDKEGEQSEILLQPAVMRPIRPPVCRVDWGIVRPARVFEEIECKLKVNELLFGLPMAVVLLQDHHCES